jgi:hypothetical protein
MPIIGATSCVPAIEPKSCAAPNGCTSPAASTSQYPSPFGRGPRSTTGEVPAGRLRPPKNGALPNVYTDPVAVTVQ